MTRNISKILPIFVFLFSANCTWQKDKYQFNEGYIYGTTYHFIYQSPDGKDYHQEIERSMQEFDLSLSIYKSESIISRINNNDTTVVLDPYFLTIFKKGFEISKKTNGAFDMTVAPLVNAWGFGTMHKQHPDSINLDSLLQLVGYHKIRLENNRIAKDDPRITINPNAIAKGYAVDVIAELLEKKGVKNYMVEIGGEVRAKGYNNKKQSWRIGIDKPIDDPDASQRELYSRIAFNEGAMATSGNYRNYYILGEKKYAHTINPKTGYPVQHNLLSVSVFAPDCLTADAYATAFMVLGLEKSIQILEQNPRLDAYFIYANKHGDYEVYSTPKIQEMIMGD